MTGEENGKSGGGGAGNGAAGNEELSRADRLRRALQSLGETLSDIVDAVEDRKGERCPYRNARDECTFRGGCRNKIRQKPHPPTCGGDHQLQWK